MRQFLRHCLKDKGGILTLTMGAYVLLFLAWQLFRWGGPDRAMVISDSAILPVSLAAVVIAFRAAAHPQADPFVRRGWLLIGLSFLAYWLGDLLWFYYEVIRGTSPSPSLADLFYLLQYPLLLSGALTVPSDVQRPGDRTRFWLDAAVVLISGWMFTWFYVLGPTTAKADGEWLTRALSVGYPVGDLLMFFGMVVVLLRRRGDYSRGARLFLALGLFLVFVGDLDYGKLALADAYHAGGWPDSFWMIGQYLMLVGAQYRYYTTVAQPPRTEPRRPAVAQILLPYAAVAGTCGLLLYAIRPGGLSEGLLLGTVVVTGIVCSRQILVLAENRRLLASEAGLVAELRRSELRFRSLVQHSSDAIAVVDAGGLIRYMSPSVSNLLGYEPEALTGHSLCDLVFPADQPEATGALADGGSRVIQCRLHHQDGRWLYIEATINNMLHAAEVSGIVLNLRDISERKALEAQLTHQAFHDPLTNLANRALLRDRAEQALKRGQQLSVLFLDLDGFKRVNDSLGHTAGDWLLVEVAARLAACVRGADTVARLGGDEFAILMEGAGEQPAAVVAGRIAHTLGAPFTVQGREVYVYASIGIAVAPSGSPATADDLLRNADVAMYSAKARGTGGYALFEPGMHRAALERLELEADLRWALEGQEFVIQYQPLVELTSGRIASVEALVRWRHPQRGTVAPAEFIPVAEETGLIIPLGRWVLEEACRQVACWQRLRPAGEPLGLSVNLSARQLSHEGLVSDVEHALTASGLASGSLVLEITESVLMQGTKATQAALEGLKRLGVQLAIDDFGTGYSSLSYLRGFPIDIVKIDRSFVDVVGKGFKETALVRGIIELSHALGLSTVAEGVESAGQLAELTGLGCQLGQGYYFGRPDDAEGVQRWLAAAQLP